MAFRLASSDAEHRRRKAVVVAGVANAPDLAAIAELAEGLSGVRGG